jgi:hypothetical protein
VGYDPWQIHRFAVWFRRGLMMVLSIPSVPHLPFDVFLLHQLSNKTKMKSKVNALKSLILSGIIAFSSVAAFAANDGSTVECCNFASVNVSNLVPVTPVVADFEVVSDEMILIEGLSPEMPLVATFDDQVDEVIDIAMIAPSTPAFADFE